MPSSDHDRTLGEERIRVAPSIVEHGTRVEVDINNLQTMLTGFFKDSRALSPGELKEAQENMRPVFASRYLEFERVGWWRFSNRGAVLELSSPWGEAPRPYLEDGKSI